MFHRFADNRDHQGAVYALAWSQNGRSFYSGSGDGFVVKRDVKSLETLDTIRVGEAVFSIWEDAARQRLWIGTQSGSIRVIDLHERIEVKHIVQHSQGVFRFVPAHSSNKLYGLGGDGVLSLWLLDDMKPERLIPLGLGKLRDLVVFPDGTKVAVACKDGSVRILETDMHHVVGHFQVNDSAATAIFLHPTKPVLLSGHADGRMHVWRLSGEAAPIWSFDAHQGGIYRLLAHRDTLISCSRDKTIKCWDLQQLEVMERLEGASQGHRHSVNDILTSSDELISASDDRQIIVWKRG